jgi:hypothetical protein
LTLAPPTPAQQGQPYWLSIDFYDETSGSLVDPAGLQADLTYGSEAPLVPDVAGPFTWDGSSSSAAPGTIWRTGTGQFTLWWDVPLTQAGGAYVITWTVSYGGDDYLVTENFPVSQLAAAENISGDLGFWTGSLTSTPAWSSSPLTINFGATDSNGVTWLLQKVDGWDSPPSAVGQVIQRSADHGGYATAQYYGPRLITLTVMASAPDHATRDAARAQMQQTVPISDLGTFTYGEPEPKAVYVRRNASAGVTESCPTLCDVVFQIPLVSPDPRKYDPDVQTLSSTTATPPPTPLSLPFLSGFPVSFPAGVPPGSQGVLCTNAGTFETRPLITVTGPIMSPSVVNGSTGQAVTFSGLTLASSDQLILDMDARQAFVDTVFTAADPSSSWWVLEPGITPVYTQGSDSGGSVLSVQFASAWI